MNLKGKRIKLLDKMINHDSKWIPEEDLPVGSEGTIIGCNITGNRFTDQIWVNWDNGRKLSVLPYIDKYEVI